MPSRQGEDTVIGVDSLIIMLVVGAIAGWLAGQIVRGFGFGLIWNIVIGIVGAFIGVWLLRQLGFMPFAGFGIAPMGQGLLAHERVIAEKPEMLRRFVRASAKALNEIVKPDKTEEAVDVAMRLSGARDERRESVKLQWLETTRRLVTKNTEGHPLGWMSDKDWAVSVDILVKTGQLEKPIPTQSLYTNEFVPTK